MTKHDFTKSKWTIAAENVENITTILDWVNSDHQYHSSKDQ